MLNYIKYYYNIDVEIINDYYDGFVFFDHDEKYYIKQIDADFRVLSSVYNLNSKLFNMGVLTHEIIYNNFNKIISIIDGKKYVLMRINANTASKITYSDVLYFYRMSSFFTGSNISSWASRWQKKIDYFENQMHEFGSKYPLILEYISFYIGMAENAISYINNNSFSNNSISVCHNRFSFDPVFFYDPFNYILDYSVRDVCGFIKYSFFYDNKDVNDLIKYVNNYSFNYVDLQYIYARLLFPTYFFDVYEDIIEGKVAENTILDIVNKSKEYNLFLHLLGRILNNKYNIEVVDWI